VALIADTRPGRFIEQTKPIGSSTLWATVVLAIEYHRVDAAYAGQDVPPATSRSSLQFGNVHHQVAAFSFSGD